MLINGIPQTTLPASDRAVQFGDGCFTTAAIHQGEIILAAAHLQRLKTSCDKLRITDVDWPQLEREMQQLAAGQQQAVLKVILSAGSGGRGYSRQGTRKATRIVSVSAWPQHYVTLQTTGVVLATSPVRLARNPQLAGIKHLNRLEQVLIRAHLEEGEADEALVLDTEGRVVECCAANLFWRKGTQIFTPNLDESGVNGVMRRYLLAQLEEAGLACQIVQVGAEAVLAADEVVICNALMPVLPVRQIDAVRFHDRSLFAQLQASCKKMEMK